MSKDISVFEREKVYGFLQPLVDDETAFFQSEYGLPEDAAKSASDIYRQRLIELVNPVLQDYYREELIKQNPLSSIAPVFVTKEDHNEAARTLAVLLEKNDDIFSAYPKLSEYLNVIRENFRGFFGCFLRRYESDRQMIAGTFKDSGAGGELKAFSASGADCHMHGSCALKAVTENGGFYYKPRDCRCDHFYRELTREFFGDVIMAPGVLSMNGYGYAEEIKPCPVGSMDEIHTYFMNFGSLLALFQALGSNDMHYENILAVGTFPVAVDLETIITPLLNPLVNTTYSSMDEMNDVWQDLMFSSVNTMVLPMMLQGKEQMSPLLAKKKGALSLPEYSGKRFTVTGYEEDLLNGYSMMYDRIVQNRPQIIRMLEEHGDFSSRYVLRASSYYAITLNQLHSPSFLEDDKPAEAEFDKLSDRFSYLEPEEINALVSWEISCLKEGDIPYFSMRSDGRDLYGDPKETVLVKDFFHISAAEHAKRAVMRMGGSEKIFELSYLKARLKQTVDSSDKDEGMRLTGGGAEDDVEAFGPCLESREALELACGIFRRIDEACVISSKGDDILLSYDQNMVPCMLSGLRSGMQGMAVFFDTMSRAETEVSECAGRLLDACRRDTRRALDVYEHYDRDAMEHVETGLYNGPGGILLSPSADEEMLSRLIDIIEASNPGKRKDPYAARGISGLAIGLYRLFEKGVQKERTGELLKLCGRMLSADFDKRSSLKEKRLSGFFCGEAGRGYALSLCAKAADDTKLKRYAKEAFEYELSMYDEKLKAWPDLKNVDRSVIPGFDLETGAAGIGLAAALAGKEYAAEPLISLAADTILRQGLPETDTLLCGCCSAALSLMEISVCTGDEGYFKKAGQILKAMVLRAEKKGGYTLLPSKYKIFFDPSLLNGYAGIGYVLLCYALGMKGTDFLSGQ